MTNASFDTRKIATPPTTSAEVLGSDGLLSHQFAAYQFRPQQLQMADLVSEVLVNGGQAVIEAGTGTGKSLGYLVPATLHALSTGHGVIVVTATKLLQSQLIDKDIPTLKKIFPELKAMVALGRGNYISKRRLQVAIENAEIDGDAPAALELQRIGAWEKATSTGQLAEITPAADDRVLDSVRSDRSDCKGKKCPSYESCHFYEARRQAHDMDIVIANTALYLMDADVRAKTGGEVQLLPDHNAVVFDEAHRIEDVAIDVFGEELTKGAITYFVSWLISGRKSVLHRLRKTGAIDMSFIRAVEAMVDELLKANDIFWEAFTQYVHETQKNEFVFQAGLCSDVIDSLDALIEKLSGYEDKSFEMKAAQNRCSELKLRVEAVTGERVAEYFYYAEVVGNPKSRAADGFKVVLHMKPTTVAQQLYTNVFSDKRSVITTSATLAIDQGNEFEYFRSRVGIQMTHALRVDSPFDYRKNVSLWLNTDDKNKYNPNDKDYPEKVGKFLLNFVPEFPGGTLVLFTSNDKMRRAYDVAAPGLKNSGRVVMMQNHANDRMSNGQIVEAFKQAGDAVVFGVASFWEGVDIPGAALSNIIIPQIPNEVPTLFFKAQQEYVVSQGLHWYRHFAGPRVAVKMKQGVGRLVRTETDTGHVVILDPRMKHENLILNALPPFSRCEFSLLENQGLAPSDEEPPF